MALYSPFRHKSGINLLAWLSARKWTHDLQITVSVLGGTRQKLQLWLVWRHTKPSFRFTQQKYTVNVDSSRFPLQPIFLFTTTDSSHFTNQPHYIHIVYIINTRVFCTEQLICDSETESVGCQTPRGETRYSRTRYSKGIQTWYCDITVGNTVYVCL